MYDAVYPSGFLSTLSLRRATPVRHCTRRTGAISIHALLAESDCRSGQRQRCRRKDFYPRSPCGERRLWDVKPGKRPIYFYPRSPCGERRNQRGDCRQSGTISIHALLAESDVHFNPQARRTLISIHALLAESDLAQGSIDTDAMRFLSTLSLRRATAA